MSQPQPVRGGWIIPYLPPIFDLKDFRKRSLRDSVEARSYLNGLVRKGRLISLGNDRWAKLGTHVCFATFTVDGFAWGKDAPS